LQKATQQLAGGDLTTRVGSVLEKRGDEFADLGLGYFFGQRTWHSW